MVIQEGIYKELSYPKFCTHSMLSHHIHMLSQNFACMEFKFIIQECRTAGGTYCQLNR